MTAQQLRNSILQQAIQGRLVPQDPNDEPASVLLEKIRKEKEQLVKEGKLKKKDLVVTPIADDEKPFDIPSGWEWCRLNDCLDVRDGTHDTPKYVETGVPLVTSKNLRNGKIDLTNIKYISLEDSIAINLRSNVDNNDILFAMIGSIGNPVLVKKEYEFSIKNMALFKHVSESTFMPYVWHALNYLQYDMRTYASGAVQSFVSLSYLRNYLFPLPPLAEQRRIVAKIEELMPLVEKYGKAQTELDNLNQDLPRRLRQSVLQQAIQGKLVEQDPQDEPASVLLEKIRNEKEQLVKEGKLKKKDLVTTPIADDEIPFDIPSGWEWCSMGILISLLSGQDLTPDRYTPEEGGIPYITGASCFIKGKLVLNRWTTSPTSVSHYGDLLITCKGTVGTMAYNQIGDIHIARQIMAISSEYMYLPYIQYFLTYMVPNLEKQAHSIIPGISREVLLNLLIPLPPLAEQNRIVAKIEELFANIDKLK